MYGTSCGNKSIIEASARNSSDVRNNGHNDWHMGNNATPGATLRHQFQEDEKGRGEGGRDEGGRDGEGKDEGRGDEGGRNEKGRKEEGRGEGGRNEKERDEKEREREEGGRVKNVEEDRKSIEEKKDGEEDEGGKGKVATSSSRNKPFYTIATNSCDVVRNNENTNTASNRKIVTANNTYNDNNSNRSDNPLTIHNLIGPTPANGFKHHKMLQHSSHQHKHQKDAVPYETLKPNNIDLKDTPTKQTHEVSQQATEKQLQQHLKQQIQKQLQKQIQQETQPNIQLNAQRDRMKQHGFPAHSKSSKEAIEARVDKLEVCGEGEDDNDDVNDEDMDDDDDVDGGSCDEKNEKYEKDNDEKMERRRKGGKEGEEGGRKRRGKEGEGEERGRKRRGKDDLGSKGNVNGEGDVASDVEAPMGANHENGQFPHQHSAIHHHQQSHQQQQTSAIDPKQINALLMPLQHQQMIQFQMLESIRKKMMMRGKGGVDESLMGLFLHHQKEVSHLYTTYQQTLAFLNRQNTTQQHLLLSQQQYQLHQQQHQQQHQHQQQQQQHQHQHYNFLAYQEYLKNMLNGSQSHEGRANNNEASKRNFKDDEEREEEEEAAGAKEVHKRLHKRHARSEKVFSW